MSHGTVLGLLGEIQHRVVTDAGGKRYIVDITVVLGSDGGALWDSIPWAWVPGQREAANERCA